MRSLLYKDLRQSAWPAVLALVLLLAPAVAWASFNLAERTQRASWDEARHELMAFCVAGAVASLIAGSSIAGVAFAKERRERTAELLATLPVARWQVVLSKSVVALLMSSVPFALGILACIVLARNEELGEFFRNAASSKGSGWVLSVVVAAWLTLFGLGWGLSSLLRSEVLASAVPLLVLIVVPVTIAVWSRGSLEVEDGRHRTPEERMLPRYVYTLGTIGLAGLVTGTAVSLRRKSP